MITVIMGARNASRYIGQAIESILSQSCRDFEFIIVEDGSTDRTLEILEEYRRRDDRIIVLRNPENMGLTKSLNRALSHARGEYVARMDADDVSHPERFEKQLEYLEQNKDIIVLGTRGITIDGKGRKIAERDVPLANRDIVKIVGWANPMIHSSVMFRKDEIERIGNYNENCRIVQDHELWFRCIAEGYSMGNLAERLLFYRMDDGYIGRKSVKYRLQEAKIRWSGSRLIKASFFDRLGVLIPLILMLIPESAMKHLYWRMKRFDPRGSRDGVGN